MNTPVVALHLVALHLVALHLGALHPVERALVYALAFGPFVVLGAVVALRRRRSHSDRADGQLDR